MTDRPHNLWEAFTQAISGRMQSPALILDGNEISFETLKSDAERCAAWLLEANVSRDKIIVLQLPKRRETYALWLACLRQGLTYVFADPRNPPPRMQQIVSRLKPAVLFSSVDTQNPHGKIVRLPDTASGDQWLNQLPHSRLSTPASVEPCDPAYIMFTSGSTGEPKGAIIPHRGVLSLMRWGRELCNPASFRFSNLNPLHFDNSVFDLFCGLVNGATLVPIETSLLMNPSHWVRRLRDGRANVIFGVPTLFQTLERLNLLTPQKLPNAKLFIFGGEGYPVTALKSFLEKFSGSADLLNVYGPTETSCICSSLSINETVLAKAEGLFPSLGHMHEDFMFTIVDEAGREVTSGLPGELWIGGPNVGLGYFDNEAETAQRFLLNPTRPDDLSIWYRSGDLVREDERGMLWFQGRVDNQIKVRGHRIELEEIDLTVEGINSVTRAVSAAIDGHDGIEIVVAFLADTIISADQIKKHCAAKLPHYMLPARVIQFDALPLNANGKVDRKAIRDIFYQGLKAVK